MAHGHLFILRGDLRRLKCDAWALPTDFGLKITEGWTENAPQVTLDLLEAVRTEQPRWNESTCISPRSWPCPDPTAWLIDTGSTIGQEAGWFGERVTHFVTSAEAEVRASDGRVPLIALPLVGSGAGGAERTKGELLRNIIPRLDDAASKLGIDIALVLSHPAAFGAAQAIRRTSKGWAISDDLQDKAAILARKQNLVLFLGAGVSQGVGLPNWERLLNELAGEANLDPDALAEFSELKNLLDRASVLEHIFAKRNEETLGQRIAMRMTGEHYSLAHGLLASLPTREVVTTNYDVLFEKASAAAGQPPSVLPYESVTSGERWLLKLHGTVDRNQGKDIVLARRDYLGYDADRGALAGIVQALLLTRHMLFVGFSLTDDNFHRMIYAVRRLLETHPSEKREMEAAQKLGTALSLSGRRLSEELWSDVLTTVDVSGGVSDQERAARNLAIFLDCLLYHASHKASFLLDETFSGLRTDNPKELISALKTLQKSAQGSTPGPIADLLDAFGISDAAN